MPRISWILLSLPPSTTHSVTLVRPVWIVQVQGLLFVCCMCEDNLKVFVSCCDWYFKPALLWTLSCFYKVILTLMMFLPTNLWWHHSPVSNDAVGSFFIKRSHTWPLFLIHFITLLTVSICAAIPSTPVLGQPKCSSRQCVIKVEQKTPHLEIQYRTEQHPWTTNPDSVRHFNSDWFWFINFGDFQCDIADSYIKPFST